jgi:protein subunit release factor B
MSTQWELWVSAGTGPIEARRLVPLLLGELARVCEDAGLERLTELDTSDESPRSLCVRVRGAAEAALGGWLGTHAIVHDSRRERGGHRRGHRKRWFMSVSLVPVRESRRERLDPREVGLCFARSGGPGGQHVNTSATAVQARHRPTGLAVRVSDSRSQAHNRELALARLAAKLRERECSNERAQARDDRARRCEVVRGQAVATWRLDERLGALCRA